jgi:ribonuclease VapC
MTGVLVDASAVVEILADFPAAARVRSILFGYANAYTTPVTRVEAGFVMMGRLGWRAARFETSFDALELEELPVDAATGRAALAAFDRFGRGRHKAKPNFGDCIAYAAARQHALKLLLIGDDFARTDIEPA